MVSLVRALCWKWHNRHFRRMINSMIRLRRAYERELLVRLSDDDQEFLTYEIGRINQELERYGFGPCYRGYHWYSFN